VGIKPQVLDRVDEIVAIVDDGVTKSTVLNSLGSVLTRLDQAIPFISLPGTVSNGIEQLDQTLTIADNAVGGLNSLLTSEPTTGERITAVGARIGELRPQPDAFNGALANVRTDVDALQPKVGKTQDTVHQLTDRAVVGGSLFFLDVALLQVLLFQQARRWARAPIRA